MPSHTTYSVTEVAKAIGCTPKWLRQQIRAGRPGFGAHLIANKLRLTEDDVAQILDVTKVTNGKSP